MSNLEKTIVNWEDLAAQYELSFILKCLVRYENNKVYHSKRNAQIKMEREEYKKMKESLEVK